MKTLLRFAVWLYPSSWRRRYGAELEGLLDDLRPGWRDVFDLMNGALTMQIRTLRMIPVVGAVAGLVVGAVIVLRTPAVFASSATILIKAENGEELRVRLARAFGESGATKAGTLVKLWKEESKDTTVVLTYQDRDPAQAQRVATKLTDAITNEPSASATILSAPDLPQSPIKRDYPTTVASGGGIGLMLGALVSLLFRVRR
jgi:uncharacterized protein involved in exopolysaccharide biosynthesis